jgi:hypothetical protein
MRMLKASRIDVFRLTKVFVGSAVLLSILAVNVPFAVFASGPMCTLACCAGRAPHAAGSCMNGSCHVSFGRQTTKVHSHHGATVHAEQLCGLSQLKSIGSPLLGIDTITIVASPERSPNAPSDQTHVSPLVFTKPCQSGDGCGTGFTKTNRQRHAAAFAYANRPRPISRTALDKLDSGLARKLDSHGRLGAPRGPPSVSRTPKTKVIR